MAKITISIEDKASGLAIKVVWPTGGKNDSPSQKVAREVVSLLMEKKADCEIVSDEPKLPSLFDSGPGRKRRRPPNPTIQMPVEQVEKLKEDSRPNAIPTPVFDSSPKTIKMSVPPLSAEKKK